MTEQPETFEEWRERTARPLSGFWLWFIKAGMILGSSVLLAVLAGWWLGWLVGVPAFALWLVVDWRRSRRRGLGLDA